MLVECQKNKRKEGTQEGVQFLEVEGRFFWND